MKLLEDKPDLKGLVVKVPQFDLSVCTDENLARFHALYEPVWEEETRPVRHFARRPWGRFVRPLYRLHWRTRRFTSLVFLYALVKDHPEYAWDFSYATYRRHRLSMAWGAFRCDFSSHSYRYQRPRYGYAKPIWKAD